MWGINWMPTKVELAYKIKSFTKLSARACIQYIVKPNQVHFKLVIEIGQSTKSGNNYEIQNLNCFTHSAPQQIRDKHNFFLLNQKGKIT